MGRILALAFQVQRGVAFSFNIGVDHLVVDTIRLADLLPRPWCDFGVPGHVSCMDGIIQDDPPR
eukprot:1146055-Amphidinium_carterae.1